MILRKTAALKLKTLDMILSLIINYDLLSDDSVGYSLDRSKHVT